LSWGSVQMPKRLKIGFMIKVTATVHTDLPDL
jgi:hypothetical protein